jgi:hypothetical protein
MPLTAVPVLPAKLKAMKAGILTAGLALQLAGSDEVTQR